MSKVKSDNKKGTKIGIQAADNEKHASETKDDVSVGNVLVDNTPVAERTEIGGRKGPEPTRFGDWEKNGRCIDF